jgi:hypothetical protein
MPLARLERLRRRYNMIFAIGKQEKQTAPRESVIAWFLEVYPGMSMTSAREMIRECVLLKYLEDKGAQLFVTEEGRIAAYEFAGLYGAPDVHLDPEPMIAVVVVKDEPTG